MYSGHIEYINNLHSQFSQMVQVAKTTMALIFMKSTRGIVNQYLEFLEPFIDQTVRDINAETKEINSE